jgi:two-component system response regulator YcbB
MLIDDDEAIRMMLQDIIEDYELGTVSQSLPSAVDLSAAQLSAIDILIIDLLIIMYQQVHYLVCLVL